MCIRDSSEGAPAARQENAPGFTLYYRVGDDRLTAVTEDNLPFGLTELPPVSYTHLDVYKRQA